MGKISNWLSKAIPGIGQYMAIAEPVLNVASQLGANKANRDIAQMNNQFNAIEAQKVRDYNTMMWNENNRYNDPSAQVQRLREAGLNPAFALGQVASGMVSSQPNAGSPASSSGNPQMQPLQLGNLYQQYQQLENEKLITQAQVRNIDADTAGKVIDNEFKHLLNEQTINKLISETDNNKERTKYQKISNNYGNELMESQIARNKSEAASANAQARLTTADAIIRELDASNYSQRFKLEIAQKIADIEESYSRRELNENQAVNAIAQTIESTARYNGIKLENEITQEAKEDIIKNLKFSNNKSYLESGTNFVRDVGTLLVGMYLLKGKPIKIKGFGK